MAEDTQYGGFWARLVALVVDYAIIFLVSLAIGLLMVAAGLDLPEIAASLLGMLIPLFYWPVLESSPRRATPGKRIMGLEVTDLEGNRLSFAHAFMRSIDKILSSVPFGIGFLIAAFTARKQALHDLLVKTLVVRTGPSQLWKIIVALIVGLVLMAASAAGLFYYVLMPMFKKSMDDTMKEAMKDSRVAPPPIGPAGKTARDMSAPPIDGMKGAMQAPAATPAPVVRAPQAAPAPTPPGAKEGPDPEFDAIAGAPLVGLEKPGTSRAGPAIFALSSLFPSSLWVKVHLPLPAFQDPDVRPGVSISVNRVLDAAGTDYYDMGSRFESEFFKRPDFSLEKAPVPHLSGTRNVHLLPGLTERALRRVEGVMTITMPVDPKPVTFGARETGKQKPVHAAAVALKSVAGNAATIHFAGPSETLLLVRGYGADGKPLGLESSQIPPPRQDLDQDLVYTFKSPPSKVEVLVASKVIERFFPFSVAQGAIAGPPSTATGGVTLPQRVVSASAAAPAAVKPAPVAASQAEPKARDETATKAVPKPAVEPKAKPAPIVSNAKPEEPRKPPPAPTPRRATAPAPAPPSVPVERAGPRFNDVMTAVLYGDAAAVTELLDMGRWADKRDSNGLTPLMAAVRARDVRIAQLLIRRGADVNASAAGGGSPLSIARASGDAAMIDLLQKSGAR